jgi:hypothetical protein
MTEEFDRPEWLPEKFRSPEDLARSYKEAENKIREQGSQLTAANENLAELSAQLDEYEQALAAQYLAPEQQQPAIDTMQELAAQQQPQTYQVPHLNAPAETQAAQVADAAVRAVETKFSDWAQFKEAISEVIANDPIYGDDRIWVNPVAAQGALERAYFAVKAGNVIPHVDDVMRCDTRALKLAAQGITGGQGGRPDPIPSSEQAWERIRAAGQNSYSELMRDS